MMDMSKDKNEQIWIIVDSNDEETVAALKDVFEDYDIVEENHCTGCGFLAIVVGAVTFLAGSENARTVLEGLFEREKSKLNMRGLK